MSASHKSLIAWQSAHEVVRLVIQISRVAWKPYMQAVFSQLQDASLSAQLNIAEGYASGRTPRCRHLLRVAYASAVETRDLLELLAEQPDAPADALDAALAANRSCQVTLEGLIRRYPARGPR